MHNDILYAIQLLKDNHNAISAYLENPTDQTLKNRMEGIAVRSLLHAHRLEEKIKKIQLPNA